MGHNFTTSRSRNTAPTPPPPVDLPPRGGLPLGEGEITAFWHRVFATLPGFADKSPVQKAICQTSELSSDESVTELARQAGGLCYEKSLEEVLVTGRCLSIRRPWQHRAVDHGVERPHLFYVYEYLFLDLGIKLPFSPFLCQVMREINVAPCQLHQNAWAFVRCFEILCDAIGLEPKTAHFFYFYAVEPKFLKTKTPGWVSLKSRTGRQRLHPYKSNVKMGPGRRYFRITVHPTYPEAFTLRDGTALFPFYWTKSPRDVPPPSDASLSDGDKIILNFLAGLPVLECSQLLEAARKNTLGSFLGGMNFTKTELECALAAETFEFPPVFNTNGSKRKHTAADA